MWRNFSDEQRNIYEFSESSCPEEQNLVISIVMISHTAPRITLQTSWDNDSDNVFGRAGAKVAGSEAYWASWDILSETAFVISLVSSRGTDAVTRYKKD